MGQFDKHNVDANADLAQRFAELGASDDFVDRIRKFGTDVPDELMHHGKKTTGCA